MIAKTAKATFLAALVGGPLFSGLVVATPASATTKCTHTIGYYKHQGAEGLGQQVDFDGYGSPYGFGSPTLYGNLVTAFGGANLQEMLAKPTQGTPEIIAAKQLIAAAANGSAGLTGFSTRSSVDIAFRALAAHFTGNPTQELTRAQLIGFAAELDAYNNGLRDLPSCD